MTFSPAELRVLELSDAIDAAKTRQQVNYERCIKKKIERMGLEAFRKLKADQVRLAKARRKHARESA